MTRASEHGLSGECRVGAEPSPSEAEARTEEADEMDGWVDRRTDGRTNEEKCRGTELGLGVRYVDSFVGLEKYESSFG